MQLDAEMLVGEVEVGGGAHANGDQHFGQEEQEFGDFVEGDDAQEVPHQQIECIARTRAESLSVNRAHDVRVFIQESQEFFQAPEETFATAQQALGHLVVVLFQLLIDELENDANNPANGDDQWAEGECSQMIAEIKQAPWISKSRQTGGKRGKLTERCDRVPPSMWNTARPPYWMSSTMLQTWPPTPFHRAPSRRK